MGEDEGGHRLAILGLLLVNGLVSLDSTIVATALPKIVQDLAGTADYAWVATGYLLASTVMMPIAGRLTDLVSARRLLLGATGVFLVGSALCGMAGSMEALIGYRTVQGLGGGVLMAVTSGVIGLMLAPRERGRVMGQFGAVLALTSVVGPLLGGVLSDFLSWRYVFYVNLPLGGAALIFLARSMPDLRPESRGAVDWAGAALLVLWSVPLLLAFSWGGSRWDWTSAPILGLLGAAALFLALFVGAERGREDALFDLSLLGDPTFRFSSLIAWWLGGANIGAMFFLPLFLVHVLDVSATLSGMVMTPLILGVVVGALYTGRFIRRTGRFKGVLLGGNLLTLVGLAGLALRLGPAVAVGEVLAWSAAVGVGLGLVVPTYPIAVQAAVERARMGTASSFLMFARMLGATMGVALLGTVLVSALAGALPPSLHQELAAVGIALDASQYQEPERLAKVFDARAGELGADIAASRGGDPVLRTLQASRLVAPELREDLGRLPVGVVVPDSLQAALRGDLERKLPSLERAVEDAAETAMTTGVRQVFLGSALMALLALLCTFPIPDRELE